MDSISQREYAGAKVSGTNAESLLLFGYVINNEFQVNIKSGSIIKLYNNIELENYSDDRFTNYLKLRETMMRLLAYLLAHAKFGYVSNQELLVQVWENYNLSSSTTRLTQVISELKIRLEKIGIGENLIQTSRGKGYTLRGATIVPLYIKEK